jgi:PiT family inorganic phosphate transporter
MTTPLFSIGPDFALLIAVVSLALAFDYINGFHDAANAIATVVATKVMTPRTAVLFGAVFNFAGALMGTHVAATISRGLVHEQGLSMMVVVCALVGATLWNLLTWWLGLPSSSSHALIGSLLGATFFATPNGGANISWDAVLQKIIIPMFSSPVLGFAVGFMLMTAITWMVYKISLYKINAIFGKLQILSACFMGLSHGNNDAQKSMGIITLALLTYVQVTGAHFPAWFFQPSKGEPPLWVMIACATMMALGTLSGGWKIIHTLGNKMIKLQPIHGFAAETAASAIILTAGQMGLPVSTTHVITTSIMGVGATKRLSALKLSVVGNILWAWILTVPLTFLFTGMLMILLHYGEKVFH